MDLKTYAERSAVYQARIDALRAGEQKDREFRRAVAAVAYAIVALAIALNWSSLSTTTLVIVAGSALFVRFVGSAIASARATKDIERIYAEHPMPGQASEQASAEPKEK